MQRASASSESDTSNESWMGSDLESAKVRSSRVFKVTASLIKRRRVLRCYVRPTSNPASRSRRIIFILLSAVYVLSWLITNGALFGTSNHASSIAPGCGNRLLNCLSLRDCSLQWRQSSPAEEDQEYLDHRQRGLPRLAEPHLDIRRWSATKKHQTLLGLEWLIRTYDERWPAEQVNAS